MTSEFKYICVAILAGLFTGCSIPPVDHAIINSNATYHAGRNVASNDCPKCIAQMRPIKGTRLVNLKVTTNAPLKAINYSVDLTSKTIGTKHIALPKNGFDGIIRVPENLPVIIIANVENDATQELNARSKLIQPNESSVTVNFEVRDLISILKNDFKKLNRNQQKKLMEIITLYNVAINSPKMLFSARKAEADGALSLFYLDAPQSFKDSKLNFYIQGMKIGLDHLDASGEDTLNSMDRVTALKKLSY